MGRYWLFAFDEENRLGGWEDMICACYSLEVLKSMIKKEIKGKKVTYRIDCPMRFDEIKYFQNIQIVDSAFGNILHII